MSSVIKLSNKNISTGIDAYVVDVPEIPLTDSASEPEGYDEQVAEPEQFEPQEPAQEIDPIQMAEQEAAEIIAAANAEADVIRAQAYDQGLQAGREAGESEWFSEMERLFRLTDEVNRERERFFQAIEPQVIRLSVEIAEKVVHHELNLSPETVLDQIRSGLRQLRDKEVVKVRVNPADVEMVKQKRPELMHSFDGLQTLEIIEDRRVDRGGCMIDAPGGVLDARIKTQFKEIEHCVMEAAEGNAGVGDAEPG